MSRFTLSVRMIMLVLSLVFVAAGADAEIASGLDTGTGTYISKAPNVGAASTPSTAKVSGCSVSWSISDDGVLTVSPSGAGVKVKIDGKDSLVWPMPNFSTTNLPGWYKYNSKIKKIVIESGFTSIGENAFYRLAQVGSVEFKTPNKINYIGSGAFQYCALLNNVVIPDEVYYMGGSCFYECRALTSITLSKNLMSLQGSVFRNCVKLPKVVVPDNVYSIEGRAFWTCSLLNEIEFSSTSKLRTLAGLALYSCPVIETITIPASVKTISSATSPVNPFQDCVKLKDIVVKSGNTVCYVDDAGNLMSADSQILYCCPPARTSAGVELEIPNSVVKIAAYALSRVKSSTVTIQEGVEEIGEYCFYNSGIVTVNLPSTVTSIGNCGFIGCSKLSSVNIPDNNHNVSSDDEAIYLKNSVGERFSLVMRFPNCEKDSYTLPSTVTTIQGCAFDGNKKLKKVDLRQGCGEKGTGVLDYVGSYAFRNCVLLDSLYFPNNVKKFTGESVCSGCSALKYLHIPDNSNVTKFGWSPFGSCTSLESVVIPRNVETLAGSMFSNCTSLKHVSFAPGSKLKTMSETCFNGCTSLERIVLPESLQSMNGKCFYGCKKLRYVEVGTNLASFGYQNFYVCDALDTIKIRRLTPPNIQADSFDSSVKSRPDDKRCHVIVPCSSRDSYEVAKYYLDFFTISTDVFEKPMYSLEVMSNDETLGTVEITAEQNCLTTTEITAYPNEGVQLLYWYDGDEQHDPVNPLKLPNMSRDVTWTAFFFASTYMVYDGLEDGAHGRIDFENKNYYFDDEVSVEVMPFSGYVVASIDIEDLDKHTTFKPTLVSEGVYTFNMPSSDVMVKVVFEQKKYQIDIESGEHGTARAALDADDDKKTITESIYGKMIRVITTPEEGYEVASVTVTRDDGNNVPVDAKQCFSMPSHDVTVEVVYEPIDYRVAVGNTFVVGNFKYKVLSLEPNTVSVAAKDATVAGNLVVEPTVTYKGIQYTITSFTDNGFQVPDVVSVTVDRTVPPTAGMNVFDADIVLKVPCGSASVYREAGYSSVIIESITEYPYTVTLSVEGEGEVNVSDAPDCDDHSATIVATPSAGYVFVKWNDGNKDNPRVISNVESNMSLKAIMEPSDFDITLVESPLVAVEIKNASGNAITQAHVGESVTVSVVASAGYTVTSVSVKDEANHTVDFNSTTGKFVMPASNVTVSVACSANNYDVVVDSKIVNGVVTPSRNSATVGQEVAFTVSPSTGYEIKTVSVVFEDGTTITNPEEYKFTMKACKATLKATFKQVNYTISVSSTNSTASSDVTTAVYGSVITVTHSAPDSRFSLASVVVTDDENGSVLYDYDSNTFTMPASNVTVVVTYEQIAEFYVGQEFTVGNFTYTITKLTPTMEVSVAAASEATLADVVNMPVDVTYGGSRFNVVAVTDNGFAGPNSSAIKTVVLSSDVPMALGVNAFKKGLSLKVPCGAVAAYKSAGYSTYFAEIEENYTGPVVRVSTTQTTLGTVYIDQQQDCHNNPIVVAEPRKGCLLSKWSDGSQETIYSLTRLSSDLDLNATFVKLTYFVDTKVVTNSASANTGSVMAYMTDDQSKSQIEKAYYADKVSVECKPSLGYELLSVSVGYKSGTDTIMVPMSDGTFEMPDADVIVWASFKATEYKINAEESLYGTIKVKSSACVNDRVEVVAAPNTGCELVSDISVVTKTGAPVAVANGQFFMPAEDVTVKAEFARKKYNVIVDNSYENGNVEVSTNSAYYQDDVTLTVTPSIGYAVSAVQLNDGTVLLPDALDNSKYTFAMPANTTTIYVSFAKVQYDIVVDEVTGGMVSAPKSAVMGETVELTVVASKGYQLSSLVVDDEDVTGYVTENVYTFIMPANAVHVTPNFELAGFAISVEKVDGGTVTAPLSAKMDESVTVSVEIENGYSMGSLLVDGVDVTSKIVDGAYTFTMPAANVQIVPSFTKNTYSIIVEESENGSVTAPTTALFGENVTVTAVPEDGYAVYSVMVNDVDVTDEVVNNAYTFSMPASNVDVKVVFSNTVFGITIVELEGGRAKAPNSAKAESSVSVTVEAESGYEFVSLLVDEVDVTLQMVDGAYTFIMPASNVSIAASFKKIPYAIVVEPTENGSVKAPSTAVVGESVNVTMTAEDGYELLSVEVGGVDVTDKVVDNTYTFTMPASEVVVKALFDIVEYAIVVDEVEGGKVVAPSVAKVGATVDVSVVADEGYELKSLVVDGVDVNDNVVDGVYTFVMPASEVKVTALFVKSEDPVDPDDPDDPDDDTECYKRVPATCLYNWLLMINTNKMFEDGLSFAESDVKWYRVVDELDDPCDEAGVADDELVGTGYYYTSENTLKGTGDYYAEVNIGGQLYRTEVFFCTSANKNIMLTPTNAKRGQVLHLSGVTNEAQIEVYNIMGQRLKSFHTEGGNVVVFDAESEQGVYLVRVICNGKQTTIKYSVK